MKSKNGWAGGSDGSHWPEDGAADEDIYEQQKYDEEVVEISCDSETTAVSESEDAGLVSHFRISEDRAAVLSKRGIASLFPIQYKTFDFIYDGRDVIGRAKTGTGKTLAFALPVVERLLVKGVFRSKKGRHPRVFCLLPTRELAQQVAEEFEVLSLSQYSVVCLYGGSPEGPQLRALREGVDVVVGTPGRCIDMLEKNALQMSKIKVFVLDESDKMLEMGFKEDVDAILDNVKNARAALASEDGATQTKIQFLLFTATLPSWVMSIARNFMSEDRVTVDVVKFQEEGCKGGIRHLLVQCNFHSRAGTLGDLVTMFAGRSGKCIIFSETKQQANEISMNSTISQLCQVLHGDIPQSQREITLKAFKEGKFRCLVATDVAARGIHVDDVELVVQMDPPKDVETYIHRSGRTGRAGKSGVCLTFCKATDYPFMGAIEQKGVFKFQRIGIPQPDEVFGAAAMKLVDNICKVKLSEEVAMKCNAAAVKLVEEFGAVEAVTKCLYELGGFSIMQGQVRSALTGRDGFKTFEIKMQGVQIERCGYVWRTLKNAFYGNDELIDKITSMTLTADGEGAVFDIPPEAVTDFEKLLENPEIDKSNFTITPTNQLPELLSLNSGDAPSNCRGGRNPNHRWTGKRGNDFDQNKSRNGGSFGKKRQSFGGNQNPRGNKRPHW